MQFIEEGGEYTCSDAVAWEESERARAHTYTQTKVLLGSVVLDLPLLRGGGAYGGGQLMNGLVAFSSPEGSLSADLKVHRPQQVLIVGFWNWNSVASSCCIRSDGNKK